MFPVTLPCAITSLPKATEEVLEAEVLEASAADLSAEVAHPDPGSTLET